MNQTEDVLVDTRGNIYITDKQWGLWILRYTGQAACTDSEMTRVMRPIEVAEQARQT